MGTCRPGCKAIRGLSCTDLGDPATNRYTDAAMGKHLCDLSKSVKKNFDQIARLVDKPKFVCTECGRAVNEKKWVCEPKKLPAGTTKTKSKSSPSETPSSRSGR